MRSGIRGGNGKNIEPRGKGKVLNRPFRSRREGFCFGFQIIFKRIGNAVYVAFRSSAARKGGRSGIQHISIFLFAVLEQRSLRRALQLIHRDAQVGLHESRVVCSRCDRDCFAVYHDAACKNSAAEVCRVALNGNRSSRGINHAAPVDILRADGNVARVRSQHRAGLFRICELIGCDINILFGKHRRTQLDFTFARLCVTEIIIIHILAAHLQLLGSR